jgi:uncharacterized repeat protein (TIGR03803 family)
MQQKLFCTSVCVAFVFLACMMSFASNPPAAERILHTFTGGNDGSEPDSGLALDRFGNLYGTTFFGGSANAGVVYRITRTSSGLRETVIYAFKGGSSDGANPSGSLLITPGGRIFGTTTGGGLGYGVVFELVPSSTGYTEKLLHAFPRGEDPVNAGVITDASGNLYGETAGGGAFGDGTIYELKHTSTGYKYALLYSFASGTDGDYPSGGLIFDSAGNLYGTTASGGPGFDGDVFELKPAGNGTWTETVLYTFTGNSDGVNPESALAMDSSGNLFGTTVFGGDTSCAGGFGCGEVFELTNSGGVWTKTIVHAFTDTPDGHGPMAGVTFDAAGNMFGTTSNGGNSGTGVLYEISPTTGGWTESVVYSFSNGADGGFPATPVTFDAKGDLFGTAQFGGSAGDGVAFGFAAIGAE